MYTETKSRKQKVHYQSSACSWFDSETALKGNTPLHYHFFEAGVPGVRLKSLTTSQGPILTSEVKEVYPMSTLNSSTKESKKRNSRWSLKLQCSVRVLLLFMQLLYSLVAWKTSGPLKVEITISSSKAQSRKTRLLRRCWLPQYREEPTR
jgi:hypothetical protein